jgi:hypothetical protein
MAGTPSRTQKIHTQCPVAQLIPVHGTKPSQRPVTLNVHCWPSQTNADTPRGAESPICDVTVTEHADAIHAKAGKVRGCR